MPEVALDSTLEAETKADGASGRLTLGGTSSPTGVTTVASETMRYAAIPQTRIFVRLMFDIACVMAVGVPLMGGDRVAKIVLEALLVPLIALCGWMRWRLRDESKYDERWVLACAYASIAASLAGLYYLGVFSAAAAVLPFGVFFFFRVFDLRTTIVSFGACAGGYATITSLVATGAIADRGLVTAAALRPFERFAVGTFVELTLLATFITARAMRSSVQRAVERHDKIARRLGHREALLQEAREELDRALKADGMGRFSDAVLGSFRLENVIGRGAMGEVYGAVRLDGRQKGAVKLLHQHALADPELLRRFFREADLVGRLDTPHVVKVLEIGGIEAPFPYIAMERLEGEDLSDHLRHRKQMPIDDVVTLVTQVGLGLEAARAAGIVHRDLKPRNLFLSALGDGPGKAPIWKILDFGVSKLSDPEATQHTKGMIVGTPAFMAPEQAAGGRVTHRTDLFSLGVIAYRCLTGRPAFGGESTTTTLFQVAHAMPPRPGEVTKLPPDVDAVLAIALAKDPADRFDSGAELADALRAAAEEALRPELRERATKILAKWPWNSKGAR